MIDIDIAKFTEVWNQTLESKGQRPLSDGAMSLIFDDLRPYDLLDILNALKRFRMNPDEGQYHLQTAAIIKLIEGDSNSASMRAWNLARRIATSIGWSRDIQIGDRILMRCIKEVGFQRLCTQESDESLDYLGNELRALYKHYRINGADSYPELLEGSDNMQRKIHGLPAIQPLFVGYKAEDTPRNRLPDMSKPRYQELQNPKPATREDASINIRKLMSLIKETEKEE